MQFSSQINASVVIYNQLTTVQQLRSKWRNIVFDNLFTFISQINDQYNKVVQNYS